jgi:hypothetical protein
VVFKAYLSGYDYHEPLAARWSDTKLPAWLEAIRQGRVLLVDQPVHGTKAGNDRTYIAVLQVVDVSYSVEDGLRFRFVGREKF